jgi:phospholipid-binding lipoprotein MlaA
MPKIAVSTRGPGIWHLTGNPAKHLPKEETPVLDIRLGPALAVVALLSACAMPSDPDSLDFDPFEASNRRMHAINKNVDAGAFGPVSRAYGETIPEGARQIVTNLRYNWRLPGHAMQYTLQGNGTRVAETVTRFAVNTIMGLGGLLDIASEMDLPYRRTTFDETFYIWGIPEGGYVEVPFGGPGTQRDWTGWALDLIVDPAYFILPGGLSAAFLTIGALDISNDRYELDPVLEELLYRSSDSYTAQRISYLQNMRNRLQGGTEVDQLEDIYDGF